MAREHSGACVVRGLSRIWSWTGVMGEENSLNLDLNVNILFFGCLLEIVL
jgi:hypothetical protein